jgi:hypothetical protein
MNEKLKPGDKIMLYQMTDESVSPGTKGTVVKIIRDPFEDDNLIIHVIWDNGSTLSLLSKYDYWKKVGESSINESRSQSKFVLDNSDLFKNFDVKFFREYLLDIRNSGIENMLGVSPLLYSGSDYITQRYGSPYDVEDDWEESRFDAYERVIQKADIAKNKLINGVMKSLEESGKDFDITKVKYDIERVARKLVSMYVTFF